MVYLHGSGFGLRNDSISFAGPDFLLDKDIVYVIFNYRINVFGFLSTGDDAAPGNFGLKDQALAFKWVKNNIRYFGGDPEEMTLFGESAGAECAGLHSLIPETQRKYLDYINITVVGCSILSLIFSLLILQKLETYSN